jgi:hypothetical protein
MGAARLTSGSGLGLHDLRGERRAACRYRPAVPEALLGWWNDSTFVHVAVSIVDISTLGAWVESSQSIAREEKQAVWLCPSALTPREWKEATIVSLRKRFLGSCQIRIKFVAPIAYDAFKTLVYGAASAAQDPDREAPEHERDDFWRG